VSHFTYFAEYLALCSNLHSTVSDAVSTVSDAVRTVSDAVSTVSDAVRTVSDAVRTVSDAGRTVSDAVRTVSDAVSTVRDAVRSECIDDCFAGGRGSPALALAGGVEAAASWGLMRKVAPRQEDKDAPALHLQQMMNPC
jgi:prophage DNA circulation protein